MGRMKQLIDTLIEKRSNGNNFLAMDIQMKLLFKGINIAEIDETTSDNPEYISKIMEMAEQFNITLED